MDLMQKMRSKLVLDHPYFAITALHVPLVADEKIPTAATNGLTIWYNPNWINKLSNKEALAVYLHELYHIIFLHPTRRNHRDAWKWNIAIDYAVNAAIEAQRQNNEEVKFELPKDCVLDTEGKYKDMLPEKIYELLPDPIRIEISCNGNDGKQQDGAAGAGKLPKQWDDCKDLPTHAENGIQPINPEQWEHDQRVRNAQALAVAKQQGKIPGGIERLLDHIQNPKTPWRELVQRWVDEYARNDYSWLKPHRHESVVGTIYMPTLRSQELPKFGVLIDTSGSIDQQEIIWELSEAQGLLTAFPDTEFFVIYVDSVAYEPIEVWSGNDVIDPKPKGGGGTDFRPGFELIDRLNLEPKFVLYFTDGYCDSFPIEPEFPVLWLLTPDSTESFKPPFGEVVKITEGYQHGQNG